MPSRIDWSKLTDYEKEDTTKGSQTMACVGGVCELVDIVTRGPSGPFPRQQGNKKQ